MLNKPNNSGLGQYTDLALTWQKGSVVDTEARWRCRAKRDMTFTAIGSNA